MNSVVETVVLGAAMLMAPVAFVGFWCGIVALLGLVSGWHGLASRYRYEGEAASNSQMTSGTLGLVSYRGTLVLATSEAGLDLRVPMMFRPGHPPLRIPWSAVEFEGERAGFLVRECRVRLGPGGPRLRVPAKVWQRIAPGPTGPR